MIFNTPTNLRSVLWLTLICTLPAACALYWILAFGVDVPFYDEWLYMAEPLREPASFTSLFKPHNDHRIVTTKITYHALLWLGSWDRKIAYLINFIFALGSTAVFATLFTRRGSADRFGNFAIALLCVSSLLFSAAQYENWTWGFQVQWFQNTFFALCTIAIFSAAQLSALRITLGVVCGVVTSITMAGGLFIWPSVAMMLFLRVLLEKKSYAALGSWTLLGALAWKAYYWDITSGHPLKTLFENVVGVWATYCAVLGAPLGNWSESLAISLGALALILHLLQFLNIIRTQERDRTQFFLFGIANYVILASFAIACARFANGGPNYVLQASRYTTVNVLLWSALLAEFFSSKHIRPALKYLAFLCFLGVQLKVTFFSLEQWRFRHFILTRVRNVLTSLDVALLDSSPEAKAAIQAVGFINNDTLQLLKARALTPFELLRPLSSFNLIKPPQVVGYLDHKERASEIFTFNGWAADPQVPTQPAKAVILVLHDEIFACPAVYLERNDVAQATKLTSLRLSGFEFKSLSILGEASQVRAFAVASDGFTISELSYQEGR